MVPTDDRRSIRDDDVYSAELHGKHSNVRFTFSFVNGKCYSKSEGVQKSTTHRITKEDSDISKVTLVKVL